MKTLTLMTIATCVFFSGCERKPEDSITVTELTKVLGFHVCEIEIPAKFRAANERFYVRKERNGGYRDLWTAFRAPESSEGVKVFINRETNEVKFLAGGELIGGFHADTEGLPEAGGYNSGTIDYKDFKIVFADSIEGLDIANAYPNAITYPDAERQEKAKNAKWVKYTLVAGSEISDPPAYVRQALESDRQGVSY